ncbi:hypothetical protein PR048_018872 [Dryococelus australis]|uniref:Uncharacterized protein n=1 Tax=Dryococelus australis TaxID=614101 RepID=A0ABQ9H1W3_9NEOP|nr:hypothetical protein PR048_018872 [Dryococelus australis]
MLHQQSTPPPHLSSAHDVNRSHPPIYKITHRQPKRANEANTERRWNAGRGKREILEKTCPTSGIVPHAKYRAQKSNQFRLGDAIVAERYNGNTARHLRTWRVEALGRQVPWHQSAAGCAPIPRRLHTPPSGCVDNSIMYCTSRSTQFSSFKYCVRITDIPLGAANSGRETKRRVDFAPLLHPPVDKFCAPRVQITAAKLIKVISRSSGRQRSRSMSGLRQGLERTTVAIKIHPRTCSVLFYARTGAYTLGTIRTIFLFVSYFPLTLLIHTHYSPPTKAIRVPSPAGSLQIFACGNRAGRCRWSAGFLEDLPALSFRCCSKLTSITLIGSEDLDLKALYHKHEGKVLLSCVEVGRLFPCFTGKKVSATRSMYLIYRARLRNDSATRSMYLIYRARLRNDGATRSMYLIYRARLRNDSATRSMDLIYRARLRNDSATKSMHLIYRARLRNDSATRSMHLIYRARLRNDSATRSMHLIYRARLRNDSATRSMHLIYRARLRNDSATRSMYLIYRARIRNDSATSSMYLIYRTRLRNDSATRSMYLIYRARLRNDSATRSMYLIYRARIRNDSATSSMYLIYRARLRNDSATRSMDLIYRARLRNDSATRSMHLIYRARLRNDSATRSMHLIYRARLRNDSATRSMHLIYRARLRNVCRNPGETIDSLIEPFQDSLRLFLSTTRQYADEQGCRKTTSNEAIYTNIARPTNNSILKPSPLGDRWAQTMVHYHDRPMRYQLHHDDNERIQGGILFSFDVMGAGLTRVEGQSMSSLNPRLAGSPARHAPLYNRPTPRPAYPAPTVAGQASIGSTVPDQQPTISFC